MDNLVITYMMIFIVLIFAFVAFAVFAIGFLIGYRSEDKRLSKRNQQAEIRNIQESDKEKKAKKDWKKFLEYDGTTPDNSEF